MVLIRKILLILLILLVLYGVFYFLNGIINPPLYVVAEFNELGPIYKNMPVYYKGYKIGKTEKIKPSDDYKTTLVTIRFYPNNLTLPDNTEAKVKPLSTTKDYIDLIYPEKPSDKILKTGDKIQGSTTIDVQSFMNAQYESGSIGYIIENASLTLISITKASSEAEKLLSTLNTTVAENRNSTKKIMNNLNKTSGNLQELSLKLNNAVSQDSMTQTNVNIQKTTENIEALTKNMNKTMNKLDSVLCNINGTAKNVNEITDDVRKAVSERNGLTRILLGNKNETTQKCAEK